MLVRRTPSAGRFVGALAIVLLAAACGAEPPQEPDAAPLAFEILLDAPHSGLDEPVREVVRDAARWQTLWAEIHRRVSPVPPAPTVEFAREMVIVVGLGTRRSSGFEVQIQSVVMHEDRLEVAVRETCPDPGGMVGMALTHPVQAVRLDRLAQEAGFHEVKASSCE
jgi:hypothetical protein